MKTFITIIFFLTLHYLSNAQVDTLLTADRKIYHKIKGLKARNIDTVICYYESSSNDIPPPPVLKDSCYTYQEKYLIWHQDGQYYMERFSECPDNPQITDSGPYKLLRKNFPQILKERIRPPESIKVVNGKKIRIGSAGSDYPVYIIKIYVSGKIIEKDIDWYDLNTKYIFGKDLNRNYLSNQKSALNKLKMLIEKEVQAHYKGK